jgi:spoIIIJ-associated protein
MKKIEAITLEEAYRKASEEFNCSITELDIEVLQYPSKGFLRIGKKNAVILVKSKKSVLDDTKSKEDIESKQKSKKKERVIQKAFSQKEAKKLFEEKREDISKTLEKKKETKKKELSFLK